MCVFTTQQSYFMMMCVVLTNEIIPVNPCRLYIGFCTSGSNIAIARLHISLQQVYTQQFYHLLLQFLRSFKEQLRISQGMTTYVIRILHICTKQWRIFQEG